MFTYAVGMKFVAAFHTEFQRFSLQLGVERLGQKWKLFLPFRNPIYADYGSVEMCLLTRCFILSLSLVLDTCLQQWINSCLLTSDALYVVIKYTFVRKLFKLVIIYQRPTISSNTQLINRRTGKAYQKW